MKKPNYVVIFVLALVFVYVFVSVSAKAEVVLDKNYQAHLDLIQTLDLDKDGQIAIKEAVAAPAILAIFGKIDKDGNGKLSQDELSKITKPSATVIKSSKVE